VVKNTERTQNWRGILEKPKGINAGNGGRPAEGWWTVPHEVEWKTLYRPPLNCGLGGKKEGVDSRNREELGTRKKLTH